MQKDPVIWYHYEVFYIESMLKITTTAVMSQGALLDILEQIQKGDNKYRSMMLDFAEDIINQAGKLSRYLWPTKKEAKERGDFLRESLQIEDNNPLENRRIRNYIEHFDEKLDAFTSGVIAGEIIPHYIGPPIKDDGVPKVYFRALFIKSDDIIFHILGEEFSIVPIINEIIRMHQMLHEFNDKGGRFPIKKTTDNT